VKDAELLLRELCAASSRLQECEYIARRAGRADLVRECRKAGESVAHMIGDLVKPPATEVVS
jgi:hypothetical protein